MQEEVTGKSVALIISSAKITEQVLDRAIRAYLDRKKQPKIYRGKQTLKQLASQNAGLSNIEITEKNIRCFTQTAKKYHVDFALKRIPRRSSPGIWCSSRAGTRMLLRRHSRSSPQESSTGSPPSARCWQRP